MQHDKVSESGSATECDLDVSLMDATRVWAKIGIMSFGGPAGQIALMHRILVEEKRWISESRFLHALNFCMLLPGPEAQQLATYVGWLMHKVKGGLIAGGLFVLPGFLIMLTLSFLYVWVGKLDAVTGIFLGLKSAVIVIVFQAVVRIGKKSLANGVAAMLAGSAFIGMYCFNVPFPVVIAIAAVVGAAAARYRAIPSASHGDSHSTESRVAGGAARDSSAVLSRGQKHRLWPSIVPLLAVVWLAPTIAIVGLLGPGDVFSNISLFFSKMAVVTFGGAYAVLAWVSEQSVVVFQWLTPGEMIDGLAMAETTPGPLILVTQHVGFLAAYRDPGLLEPGVAGILGASLTTWVTFVPCFLWIFAGAPYIERLRGSRALSGALAGVTAAVVGVIANLAVWFSIHALFDATSKVSVAQATFEIPVWASIDLAALTIVVIAGALAFRFERSVPVLLLVCGALGLAARFAGWA